MRSRRINWLLIFSLVCLLGSVGLLILETVRYSQAFRQLPAGLALGGVPVGGLTEEEARQQLLTTYATPLELNYLENVILLNPGAVSFEVNAAVMLPQATQSRNNANFWSGFLDYMWLRTTETQDVPLRVTYSPEQLRAFLQDVAARYDRPGSPPKADPNTLGFLPGERGHTLNVDAAISLIDAALRSPTQRAVVLPVAEQTAIQPTLGTLGELLAENARQFQFNGVMSVYLADLRTGDELALTLSNSQPITGPVAFSAMSTIKIPIMAAFFSKNVGALTSDENLLLQRSMEESANESTDFVLRILGTGDGLEGTRSVTSVMRRLGLENTFISGLLNVAGSVLAPLGTPANQRADINLGPDPYNQTTAQDMGVLLVMIHQCSKGGGALIAAFPGQFTPEECQQMIQFLTANQVGPIFISGGTPGGVIAHKHGWDTLPLTNVGDAALVFTPGGDYALTFYLHAPETILFEDANRILISMARAVYGYYNPAQ
jgi:beta-lactamase class A